MKIDREKHNAKCALRAILKWDFATDGRKFNGNYKEVLKQVMILAKLGLPIRDVRRAHNLKLKPPKSNS